MASQIKLEGLVKLMVDADIKLLADQMQGRLTGRTVSPE